MFQTTSESVDTALVAQASASASLESRVTALETSPVQATRQVPIALTTPVNGYTGTVNTGLTQRWPFRLPVGASRVRAVVQNHNRATDQAYAVPDLRCNLGSLIGKAVVSADTGRLTGDFVSPTRLSGGILGVMDTASQVVVPSTGALRADLAYDGVHLVSGGYALMARGIVGPLAVR